MYYRLVGVVRLLLALFFRRIEVAGQDRLPPSGGGILVSWHPNGVIDPALILTQCPSPVVFGAREGLFRVPGFGALVRALGTVPIHRAQDATGSDSVEARRAANARSLDALARAVAEGKFSALFPEGVSHDDPRLKSLKTGAARLYYRAAELALETGRPAPALIPVGLYYDRKSVFRSSAFVRFYEPVVPPNELAPENVAQLSPDGVRRAQLELTQLIDDVLHRSVHATESWELHAQMERARSLVRAERAHRARVKLTRAEIGERARGFSRVWHAYEVRVKTHPEETRSLMARLRSYDEKLRALDLKDEELDHPPKLWISYGPFVLGVQLLCLYLLLPPVLVFGFAVNAPPYFALKGIVARAARLRKDEASIKLLVGVVLFLSTWTLVAGLSTWGLINLSDHFPGIPTMPGLTFATVFALCAIGAFGALHHKVVMRQTIRALMVRVTRRRQSLVIAELREERAFLHDGLLELAKGVALPYEAEATGVVVETART